MTYTREELIEGFQYLIDLRDSGRVNMFGAIPYMVAELGWKEKQCRDIWNLWVDNFNRESTPEELADKVLG